MSSLLTCKSEAIVSTKRRAPEYWFSEFLEDCKSEILEPASIRIPMTAINANSRNFVSCLFLKYR